MGIACYCACNIVSFSNCQLSPSLYLRLFSQETPIYQLPEFVKIWLFEVRYPYTVAGFPSGCELYHFIAALTQITLSLRARSPSLLGTARSRALPKR